MFFRFLRSQILWFLAKTFYFIFITWMIAHTHTPTLMYGHVSQVHYHCQGCRNEWMTVKGCLSSPSVRSIGKSSRYLSHSLTHDQRFESAIDFALHPSSMYVKTSCTLGTPEVENEVDSRWRQQFIDRFFCCAFWLLFIAEKKLRTAKRCLSKLFTSQTL